MCSARGIFWIGWTQRGYDFAYVPRVGYTTADIDIHDVAVDAQSRVVFVNTLFGCLAMRDGRLQDQRDRTPVARG